MYKRFLKDQIIPVMNNECNYPILCIGFLRSFFVERYLQPGGAVERKLLERDQYFLQKACLFNQFMPHTIH